jgi:hypothetical protein
MEHADILDETLLPGIENLTAAIDQLLELFAADESEQSVRTVRIN